VISSIGNWLDWYDFLLADLMWVTGCPALMPVNTSSEKRSCWKREGKLFSF